MTDEEMFEQLQEKAKAAAERAAARSEASVEPARPALARLLSVAETSGTGQAAVVRNFFCSLHSDARFDFYDLRALDEQIGDDIIAVIDFVRWGKCAPRDLIENGLERLDALVSGDVK